MEEVFGLTELLMNNTYQVKVVPCNITAHYGPA